MDRAEALHVDVLVRAFHAGLLQVVSTLALEEEIVGAARQEDRKYREMRPLHHKLVGRRSLLPLNERHIAEARHGGKLPVTVRYDSKARQDQVRRFAGKHEESLLVGDEVWAAKQATYVRQVEARTAVRSRLEGLGARPDTAVNEWFGSADIANWVKDLVDDSVSRGLFSWSGEEEISASRFPSSWLLVAYTMARIKRTVADNRKIQPSDHHDAEHCAAGAYFDVLVTSDKEFATTLGLIPDLPFKVTSPIECSQTLDQLLGVTPTGK